MSTVSATEAEVFPGDAPEFQLHLVDFDRVGEVSRLSPNMYIEMPTGFLNAFGQQRNGRNEIQGALTDSLEEGQIHAISVVMASDELTEEYRQFTNKTWGANVQPEDLKPMSDADPFYPGMYAILCAGHSRTDGIRELARRAGANPDTALIEARIHEVKTIEDILRIQIAENIHAQPSPDRGLRAVAEMYLFQKERNHGQPPEKAAFRRRYKLSEQTLSDAINYVQLPLYIRNLTDDDGLPFGIIKEFARARQVIVDNAEYLADRDPRFTVSADTPADERSTRNNSRAEKIDELVRNELMYLMKGVHERGAGAGKNILSARNFIKGHAKGLRDKITSRDPGELVMAQTLFEDPETLEGRLKFYGAQVQEYVRQMFTAEQLKQNTLARSLARLAEAGIEAGSTDGVLKTIEAALALARAAVPETVEV